MNEQHLREMLEFISTDWTSRVYQKANGVFEVPGSFVHVDSDVFNDPDRECAYVTIDFNVKRASWFAAYVSGHNGDTYGDKMGEISWERVLESYPVVRGVAKVKMGRDILAEDEKRAKQTLELRVEARMKDWEK